MPPHVSLGRRSSALHLIAGRRTPGKAVRLVPVLQEAGQEGLHGVHLRHTAAG
jgi:hypothetical protein